ncbi:putative quinol monooxygenase [Adhaeretor mobilis]|uniref:Autoinducer 2-degrading protein LsrG n=1 Tax=Adhaeretor mobilis TaxID=1930276 RepID=A0A517MZ67_9BACT|nr:putative quinol monooxygenase [Adhaeretor mobilis]QDT00179.1 Autoinducer 2-degrading protein LsrG [Adhaeretor mobilis]
MIALSVKFDVAPEHVEAFRVAVLQHAKNSLGEEGCRRFDVCIDPEDAQRFFLYEMYDDKEALEVHRAADYFTKFGDTIENWVTDKDISLWKLASATAADAV